MVTKVTKANFDAEVLNSGKPVLIDFWAAWCGPCRMLGPLVEMIAAEHPEYKICKVNVDEEQQLAAQFNVMSIPTVLAFKDGRQVAQSVGVVPKEKLLSMLQ